MIINQHVRRLVDTRTALEDLGREQPEEIMDAMLADDWKQDPRVKTVLIEEAIRRMKFKLGKKTEIAVSELIQLLPSLSPAFQQAVMMVLQGQAQPGGRPGQPGQPGAGGRPGLRPPAVGVTASPGVAAVPQPPGAGHVGPVTRPSGIATGRAPGVRKRGVEG